MYNTYYVSKKGSIDGDGSVDNPFIAIQQAADIAMPGDTITVGAGVYREWVKPVNGGAGEGERITYQAAEGEKVMIKGSEIIDQWEHVEGTVWKKVISNEMFGNYNPYKETVSGDWFEKPSEYNVHTGEVYINGRAMYEVENCEKLYNPEVRETGYTSRLVVSKECIIEPENTIYVWYAEVNARETTLFANFQDINPNEETIEINVRKCCFYPTQIGRNYITVKGFEMAQAATPWAPPTADQPGLIGANWSRCWIIENNIIHDSKCSGISIGKEASTGHNIHTSNRKKPGYQNQLDVVFRAAKIGWSKELVGSHIIRNNTIYDCGQTGIVGHLGCIFSIIENNEIYRIGKKYEFFGHEIAGIKLHASIDVQIIHNNIHDCTLGTWLDWQAQGIRVSKNLYYNNNRDFFIEVTHGPQLIDHNIFGSTKNLQNAAQGSAYVHNLFAGGLRRYACMNRSTPYHAPHSTDITGCIIMYGADDRFYRNIYIGGSDIPEEDYLCGNVIYDGCPDSFEKYMDLIEAVGVGDETRYEVVSQPMYINENCYLNGAPAFCDEKEYMESACNPNFKILKEEDGTYLEITLPDDLDMSYSNCMTTKELGVPRATEAPYEAADGRMIIFDQDFNGEKIENSPLAGPLQHLVPGYNKVRVW